MLEKDTDQAWDRPHVVDHVLNELVVGTVYRLTMSNASAIGRQDPPRAAVTLQARARARGGKLTVKNIKVGGYSRVCLVQAMTK